MSVRRNTPCDLDGICPYENMHSGYWNSCEYWCGAEEPEDSPDDEYESDVQPTNADVLFAMSEAELIAILADEDFRMRVEAALRRML